MNTMAGASEFNMQPQVQGQLFNQDVTVQNMGQAQQMQQMQPNTMGQPGMDPNTMGQPGMDPNMMGQQNMMGQPGIDPNMMGMMQNNPFNIG